MFTGIIEETGKVREIHPGAKAIRLVVEANVCAKGTKTGDSVAVNGCCLTVVNAKPLGRGKLLAFDLLKETWVRTNLQFTKPGSLVNLERPLLPTTRLGGHFVTGHVDGLGKIERWEKSGDDWVLDVSTPNEIMDYVIFKGSIAVDGISLTVAEVRKKQFRVWIIPHTYAVTALQERRKGDSVNLEGDLLGKYVKQFTSGSRA
jgi:riboflavin synthase